MQNVPSYFLRELRLIVATRPVRFRCLRDTQSANSQSLVRGWLLGWKTIRAATEYYALSLYRAARRHLRRKARRSLANLSPRYPLLFPVAKNTPTGNRWILLFCVYRSQQTIGRRNLLLDGLISRYRLKTRCLKSVYVMQELYISWKSVCRFYDNGCTLIKILASFYCENWWSF